MAAQRDRQNRRQVYRAAAPGPMAARPTRAQGAAPALPRVQARPDGRADAAKDGAAGGASSSPCSAAGLLCLLGGLALRSLLPRHYVVALTRATAAATRGSGVTARWRSPRPRCAIWKSC